MDDRYSTIFRSFSLQTPKAADWAFLGLIVLALAVVAAVGGLVYYRVQKRKAREGEAAEFERVCAQDKLDEEERAALDEIVAAARPEPLTRIFAGKNVFDRAVAEWAKTVNAALRDEKADILASLRRKLGFARAKEGLMVVSSRSLKPKQVLGLELTRRDPPIAFQAPVLQVDDFGVTVQVPEDVGGKIHFIQGEPLDVEFNRPGEGTYGFLSRIVEVPSQRRLVIEHSEKLSVSQQRASVRIDVHLPIKFKRIPAPWAPDKDQVARLIGDDRIETMPGTVVNLSSDGALVRVEEKFYTNDCIHFRLQFDAKERDSKITFYCKVLGASPHANGKEFLLRTQFVDMAEPIRERLVQYLFRVQTESVKEKSGLAPVRVA
ncbi:MAG: PilZ domain-containing protein [Nitrospirae bacterium]|nr:PilZ domain-containing protein [Nitrospirota bacterium]